MPNNYSVQCLQILEKIGLTEKLTIDSDNNVKEFKSTLPFFHPKRHIPPTNPTDDINISPVNGYLFSVCKSMQNLQRLLGAGGCSKYVCKYIAKVDEQNYLVVEIEGKRQLVTKAYFLHNTKLSTSSMGESKEKKKQHNSSVYGCISHMEMMHLLLRYPEIITNLDFIKVSTMPLELRPGIPCHK